MNIRKATIDDAQALATLHRDTIIEVYGAIYPASAIADWSGGHTATSWVTRLDSASGSTMLVAEEAGQIWGCGGMTGNRMGVYVHPSAHRRGIATALIQAMEKIALERGITELELSAPERAVAFYQSVGFTLIGPKTHAFKNGSELTTYDMVKTI